MDGSVFPQNDHLNGMTSSINSTAIETFRGWNEFLPNTTGEKPFRIFDFGNGNFGFLSKNQSELYLSIMKRQNNLAGPQIIHRFEIPGWNASQVISTSSSHGFFLICGVDGRIELFEFHPPYHTPRIFSGRFSEKDFVNTLSVSLDAEADSIYMTHLYNSTDSSVSLTIYQHKKSQLTKLSSPFYPYKSHRFLNSTFSVDSLLLQSAKAKRDSGCPGNPLLLSSIAFEENQKIFVSFVCTDVAFGSVVLAQNDLENPSGVGNHPVVDLSVNQNSSIALYFFFFFLKNLCGSFKLFESFFKTVLVFL